MFRCELEYELGDGRRVELWWDKWGGMSTLGSQFPGVFSAVVNKCSRMSECFRDRGWRWRKILKGVSATALRGCPEVRMFKAVLSNLRPGIGRDGVSWRWSDREGSS